MTDQPASNRMRGISVAIVGIAVALPVSLSGQPTCMVDASRVIVVKSHDQRSTWQRCIDQVGRMYSTNEVVSHAAWISTINDTSHLRRSESRPTMPPSQPMEYDGTLVLLDLPPPASAS